MNHDRPGPDAILRLSGPGELDHLDPACAPRSPADQLTRLFTRQLFAYRSSPDPRAWQAITPVPDLATEIPSIYNAGLGTSYTSYVVHLRPDVLWDTTPPRPVTTDDVIRGLKRMCAPVSGCPVLVHFTSTIRGLAEFRDGYAAAVPGPDPAPAELADYQNSHDIPGLLVLDERSMVFELVRPALDFIDILALPCASPAPVEYDGFVPGAPESLGRLISAGPYRLTDVEPGRRLRLEPNPVWRPDTDPVRRRNLAGIEVRRSSRPAAELLRSGAADLPWGDTTSASGPAEPAPSRPDLGQALGLYLVFNTTSPRAGGALGRAAVRQAISFAIDKAALAELGAELWPGSLVRTAGCVVPPGNDAHQDLDPYPTPDHRGDPARCAALLAQAGYPDGLVLTAAHPDTEAGRRVAERYRADLAAAGVTVRLVAVPAAGYRDHLQDRARAEAGDWDIAASSWAPGWFHHNARAFLQPLLGSDDSPTTANLGRYRNPEVDALIERALDADADPRAAEPAWHKVERVALAEAAVVPVLFRTPAGPPAHSDRVRDVVVLPATDFAVDLCAVRLQP